MRVIAELPNDKVLVEMSKDEFANIIGYYSKNSGSFQIKIGVDVDISDIYRKHNLIKSLQNTAEYDRARKKLKDILDALTPIEDKINVLKLPE